MDTQKNLLARIIEVEKLIKFAPEDSFICSYPEFIKYFKNVKHIERHHLIIAANFTYGWMPTMFRFKSSNFEKAIEVLNRAKQENFIDDKDLQCLVNLINNSIVGASKILHFVNPEHFGIWDSRVYRYLFGNFSMLKLNKFDNYRTYLKDCQEVIKDFKFAPVHKSINDKIGYQVTPVRAAELVMFMSGIKQKN